MSLSSPRLMRLYSLLLAELGPQHWWPGDTPWEIAVGAVLTQNTSWHNVEIAISNLKKANLLTAPRDLLRANRETIARHLFSAGYYNVKTQRIQALAAWWEEQTDGLQPKKNQSTGELRKSLLAVKGIGPETADSILLYAFNRPVFVIDAYTRRILLRHEWVTGNETYTELQASFHSALPPNAVLYNEFHALLVAAAKFWCGGRRQKCAACPLQNL